MMGDVVEGPDSWWSPERVESLSELEHEVEIPHDPVDGYEGEPFTVPAEDIRLLNMTHQERLAERIEALAPRALEVLEELEDEGYEIPLRTRLLALCWGESRGYWEPSADLLDQLERAARAMRPDHRLPRRRRGESRLQRARRALVG